MCLSEEPALFVARRAGTAPQLDTLDLAEAWRVRLEAGELSRADLARERGVSRARVTQIISLLDVLPRILDWVRESPGAVPERRLRPLMRLPLRQQLRTTHKLGLWAG